MQDAQEFLYVGMFEWTQRAKLRSDVHEPHDDKEEVAVTYSQKEASVVLNRLREDLEVLGEGVPQLQGKPSLDKEQLEKFISNPEQLTQEDWRFIKKLRTELEEKKRKNAIKSEEEEDIHITEERKKSGKKYLNARDGWWPL